MGGTYWRVVAIAAVFTLARFSEGFLTLRGQSVGLPIMLVPAVLVVMNVAYAFAAYPVGVLSDRVGRTGLLAVGLVLLVGADIVLAFVPSIAGVAAGAVLWGLHMGFTQGLLATLVADTAPAELRGTAYGYFNLLTGLAMVPASMLAGFLWDTAGPQAAFLAGAAFAALAALGLLAVKDRFGSRAPFGRP